MSCTCTRCRPKDLGRYAATTTVDGNKLIINITVCSKYLVQGDRLVFFIPSCITYPSTAIKNAILSINGTEFTLIKFGDVKWDQIRNRQGYCVVLGTESLTATILNDRDLKCSAFDFPVYETSCTTTEATEEASEVTAE